MESFGISWDKDDTESEGQVIKSKLTYDAKDHLQETTQDNVKYPVRLSSVYIMDNLADECDRLLEQGSGPP